MSSPPAFPRPSATIVVLRDAADGPEALLVERHGRSDFPGAHVFPGGLLDAGDAAAAAFCEGVSEAEAVRALGVRRGALAWYAAAIRECFEEVGLLFAYDAAGGPVGDVDDDRLAAYRRALAAHETDLGTICRRERWRLAADRLRYLSYWVTPTAIPRRYATRFFVAEAFADQAACADGVEALSCLWGRPPALLEAAREGVLTLHPPTRANLEALAPAETAAMALRAAAERSAGGVEPVLPVVVDAGGERRVVLPGQPGYPEAPEGLPDERV
jgi:8-oxo-dGTP pyrophosphatase MutT (NUDIX family)